MSYTRSYHQVVSGSTTVSYPASQSGGTKTAYVEIPVDIHINVDTTPFDVSVKNADREVNNLTAVVVSTEAAEVKSKENNSVKVANTIIGGFFSLIRSEISSKIAELYQNVEAQIMHLKELAESCLDKKKQMEGDYNRITSRYDKIFKDLNSELSNRIYELDKPAFIFKKECDEPNNRIQGNDQLVNTVSIFGSESIGLHSKLSSSVAKKRALDTLRAAETFLWQQKKLETTLQKCMINESKSCNFFIPICFTEFNNEENELSKNIHATSYLPLLKDKTKKNELLKRFSADSIKWENFKEEDKKIINIYINEELNKNFSDNEPHNIRVREMIQKITDFNYIKTVYVHKI